MDNEMIKNSSATVNTTYATPTQTDARCATCGGEGGCPDCDPIVATPARRHIAKIYSIQFRATACSDCGTLITTGKSIHWCRLDREFRGHFDGQIICFKGSYHEADQVLNNYVYDLIAAGLLPCPLSVEETIYDLDTAANAARHDDGMRYLSEIRKAA